VLADPADCFQVTASGDGLGVTVAPGFGMIKGRIAYDPETASLTLDKAPTKNSRIDRVVLRCSYLDRLCEIVVKTGTAAATPVAPDLEQPSAGDYYELGLASITISANQTVLTQAQITDTRADSSVCGYITQLIDSIDTSVFFAQLDQFYADFVAKTDTDYENSRAQYIELCQAIVDALGAFEGNASEEFTAWFDEIKGQLSEDAAGNLQNEVDAINEQRFLDLYGLCSKTTLIEKDPAGVTSQITEADDGEGVTATTTFTRDASGIATQVVTRVIRETGIYNYVKTVDIETTDTGKKITESYTKELKA
jgi:hypothetical protein